MGQPIAIEGCTESVVLYWRALTLTPALGPTRSRKLAEHFGGVQEVFQATLTELEATGIQVVSAQALANGKSIELAQQEMLRPASLGELHMSRSRVISCPAETDLRSSHHYLCAWECGCRCAAGDRGCGPAASDALWNRHG
jgi:hypothetical protein